MNKALPTLTDVWSRKIPCLGMMGLAGTNIPSEVSDQHLEAATRALQTALDAGYVMFDHADIYGHEGSCENVFRKAMAVLKPDRSALYIASKCGIQLPDQQGPYRYNSSYDHVISSVEGSLQRLGLDYLDLYQVHRRDPLAALSDTAKAMNRLNSQGLIRDIGVSNFSVTQLQAFQHHLDYPVVSVQSEFSLLHQQPMTDGVFDLCEHTDLVFLAYSPVKKGILLHDEHPPHWVEQMNALTPVLNTLTQKYQASASQLALAWIRQFPFKNIPVYGSNNPIHIEDAAASAHITLDRLDWYQLWKSARAVPIP